MAAAEGLRQGIVECMGGNARLFAAAANRGSRKMCEALANALIINPFHAVMTLSSRRGLCRPERERSSFAFAFASVSATLDSSIEKKLAVCATVKGRNKMFFPRNSP